MAKTKRGMSRKKKEILFLSLFLLFPTIQFLIFYVGVNFNSILLAFRKYTVDKEIVFAGLENFQKVWNDLFVNGRLVTALTNSAIQLIVTFILATPIHIIVAYAIFKAIPGSGFFKVMLFLPSMISSMVFVICARYLISNGFPALFGEAGKDLLVPYMASSFWTVLWFGFWLGLSSGLIIYLGAMGSISKDVLEYDKLENLSSVKELWYVVIPLIFPTIKTYILVGIASFFTNYGHFYSFFEFQGADATPPFETLGYVFFVKISNSTNISDYPYAAAGGLMFTAVLAPITFIVRALLDKFGPKED